MEGLKEMWSILRPYVCSTPVFSVLGCLLALSVIKKALKVAAFIGAIVLLLIVLGQAGVDVEGFKEAVATVRPY